MSDEELIQLCKEFLSYLNVMYQEQKISREQFQQMTTLKISFLKENGIDV